MARLRAEGGQILGRNIVDLITVNGVRVALEDGSWVLVRASSNKPEIVVVVESSRSADDMRALFREEVKPRRIEIQCPPWQISCHLRAVRPLRGADGLRVSGATSR